MKHTQRQAKSQKSFIFPQIKKHNGSFFLLQERKLSALFIWEKEKGKRAN